MITALIGHLPFWQIYGLLFSGGLVFVFILSVPLFLPLYKWQPTKGQVAPYKTLLRYPSDSTIRSEIYWAIIGLTAGVLCPAISTYLSFRGQNMMYVLFFTCSPFFCRFFSRHPSFLRFRPIFCTFLWTNLPESMVPKHQFFSRENVRVSFDGWAYIQPHSEL